MTTTMSYAEAVLAALEDAMHANPCVNLVGRPFSLGPTRSLAAKLKADFPNRVFEPPTSEPANAALGAGAAMAGMRPFVDLGTGAFSFLAFSGIANEAAVARYMSGGQLKAPVVYHVSDGVRGSGAPQHSHNMHGYLWGTPGLQVVLPATPNEGYGLVRGALESDNPTFLVSHFKLPNVRGPVERGAVLPIGKAHVARVGKDVTIVALSLMVQHAMEAAGILAADGIEVEIVNPRTLTPLDEDTILASVRKTGRLVVVDETPLHGGVSSGIAGMVADRGYSLLKAPIRRLGRANAPIPASLVMEAFLVPTPDKIIDAVKSIV